MKKLNKKTKYIMISTIIIIGLNLILMVTGSRVVNDRDKFGNIYITTFADEIRNVIFIITLLLMVILGIVLMIKSKKERSKLVFFVGLISIILSVSITIINTIETTISSSRWETAVDKPVLYLYPEKEEKITVTFEHPENLLTTYPKYKTEWKVTAKPDGSLYDENNKYYYALYWDEKKLTEEKFEEGFFVTKENAIEFLETTLTKIGLTSRERNEFIMYWLPILEKNEQSVVNYTLTEERQKENKLMIVPEPDSLLRVAINIKKVDRKINIKEQNLPKFTREGFTAVEWGGSVYS